MLIYLKVRDKRYGAGFNSVFFHEDDITPDIYKFVKKKKDKIISLSFLNSTKNYWNKGTPNILDFLTEYKHLEK